MFIAEVAWNAPRNIDHCLAGCFSSSTQWKLKAPGQSASSQAYPLSVLNCGQLPGSRMDHQKSRAEANAVFFLGVYENSEFWSCVGYDGLSIAFDLPIEHVRSLTEDQKRSMMGLLSSLAKMRDETLVVRLRALECLPADERLIGLMALIPQV
jgi:hypothetical protein